MTVKVCRHGYEVGYCLACLAESCGPTHHLACACREAKVARLVEQNGIVCVSDGPRVDLAPYGSKVWCEFDERFGPLFYRRNGKEITNPSPRTWAAFKAWYKDWGKP